MAKDTAKTGASLELLAALGCAWSGVVWGLFWLPLRGLADLGISGSWASVIFFAVPAILVLPLLVWHGQGQWRMGWKGQFTCLLSVFSMVLYAEAVLRTDVIRAILLFYTTPLWSTFFGIWLLQEKIRPVRWLSMAMAFLGMMVIFGGFTLPERTGDWMALAASVTWAWASVRLNQSRHIPALDVTISFSLWGVPSALVFLLLPGISETLPQWSQISASLVWLVPFGLVVMLPGVFSSMFGARHLSPGLVGLLFMTEIVVGTITVAIWSGEVLGPREWLGAALISGAALTESLWNWRAGRA